MKIAVYVSKKRIERCNDEDPLLFALRELVSDTGWHWSWCHHSDETLELVTADSVSEWAIRSVFSDEYECDVHLQMDWSHMPALVTLEHVDGTLPRYTETLEHVAAFAL